jgi:O-antigen/teichoic acid export membrane protein
MPGEGSGPAGNNHKLMSPRAALSVANSVIGAVLGTAALVFIAKNMGPDVLGILGFAMATVGIMSFFSDFGVGSVHVLHIKSGENLGKCVGAYAAIRLVLLAIFSIVTFVLIELWKNEYMGGATPPSNALVDSMYVFLVYYILLGVNQIATHTFDALDRSVNVYVPSILELVVRVSFIIYIAVSAYGSSEDGPALLASAYTAGIISSTLLAAFFMSKVKIVKPGRAVLMKYIRSLAPVFVVSMIIIFDLYLDKAVVGYFWGANELGLYFGVQKMAVFVGVFSLSVATLILPSVTTYWFRKDAAATWDVVNQAERYVSLVVIPTAAFYLVYGTDILKVFLTDEFATSVRTMDVLVIGSAIVALVLPLRSSIAGVGKSATLFWIGMGGLVLQLGLMLVLVPDDIAGVDALGLKGLGAALALLLGSIYYFFILRYMAWRTTRIMPVSHSFKHILSAIVMIGVMYLVDWVFIPAIDWIALIVLAVVAVFSYGATAYVIGELDASDYRYFRSMLNPQGTLEYVVNELLGKRGH